MQTNKTETFFDIFLHGTGNFLLSRIVMIAIGIAIAFAALVLMIVTARNDSAKYTETTDVADYGNFTGTASDSYTTQYIASFFPSKIESSFSNVKYSYKAEDLDACGFEAYLEFTIEDRNEFDRYISMLAKEQTWKPCPFDSSFQEYSIENTFVLDDEEKTDARKDVVYHQIVYANIKKILYSAETQTVIYVAMVVDDGGCIGTNYLNTFFSRFDIDPLVYQMTSLA